VYDADEVRHALAQIQHAIRAPCVDINGYFQRLVKAHRGGAMKDDINSSDQDVLVRGLEPEFWQAYIALYGQDLAEGGRKFRSYPIKNLRSRKTGFASFSFMDETGRMRSRRGASRLSNRQT